jgi:hypothetical protein
MSVMILSRNSSIQKTYPSCLRFFWDFEWRRRLYRSAMIESSEDPGGGSEPGRSELAVIGEEGGRVSEDLAMVVVCGQGSGWENWLLYHRTIHTAVSMIGN